LRRPENSTSWTAREPSWEFTLASGSRRDNLHHQRPIEIHCPEHTVLPNFAAAHIWHAI